MAFDWPDLPPGWDLSVSGTRQRTHPDLGQLPTIEAVQQLRLLIEEAISLGARWLHHGACTGWDEASVTIANRCNGSWNKLIVVAHPPLDQRYLSVPAVKFSHVVHRPRIFKTRNDAIAYEGQVNIIGPAYAENDPRSRRSGTWQTARLSRAYGSRVYAITMTGDTYDATEG